MVNGGDSSDSLDTESVTSKDLENRARSEERNQHRSRASPRSKSVDPYLGRRRKWLMVQSYPPVQVLPLPVTTYEAPSGIPKVTEYRSQFIWMPSSETTPQVEATPKKSISMGALQAAQAAAVHQAQVSKAQDAADKIKMQKAVQPSDDLARGAPKVPVTTKEEPVIVSKKVSDHETGIGGPILNDMQYAVDEEIVDKQPIGKLKKFKTEYKAQFRAPSKYMYVDGGWKKMSRSADSADLQKDLHQGAPWYGEVMELRKKAGEYKYRSTGGHIMPEKSTEAITRQEMIEQLTARSSLSALALATTPSATSKKAKEFGIVEQPSTHRPSPTIRHHLDRTTPGAGDLGVLITSPTRDHKLEPVQKPIATKESKSVVAKGKPMAKSTQKPLESQLPTRPASGIPPGKPVGSIVHRSPKRTPRPMSMILPGSKSQVTVVNGSSETPRKVESKRPRPTSLVTSTTPMRPKSTVSSRSTKPVAVEEQNIINGDTKSKPGVIDTHAPTTVPKEMKAAQLPAKHVKAPSSEIKPGEHDMVMMNGEEEKSEPEDVVDNDAKKGHELIRTESQEIEETMMMKSPPEPTRVKSPDQILVRSPEPVKWTIPLETGIKWTGTPKSEETEKQIKETHGSPMTSIAPPETPPSPISQQPIGLNLSLMEDDVYNVNMDQHEDILSYENET